MSTADIVALAAFLGTFLGGLLLSALYQAVQRRPIRLIRLRVRRIGQHRAMAAARSALTPADLFSTRETRGALYEWFAVHSRRVTAVGGVQGLRLLVAAGVLVGGVTILLASIVPLPVWGTALLIAGLPAMAVTLLYRRLINRFRERFLAVFPDALDAIVRAVRAGVPVVRAIGEAGGQAEEPVRTVFRHMGDRLRLGIDLKEVLDTEVERIGIADFSFFSVCLMLQRETGGPLSETLANLAGIIRTRRDIRLKTRALTAEGRMASKIIAAVPFAVVLALYFINRDYIIVLFTTGTGHKILTIAAILMSTGLLLINKIAKLNTSR